MQRRAVLAGVVGHFYGIFFVRVISFTAQKSGNVPVRHVLRWWWWRWNQRGQARAQRQQLGRVPVAHSSQYEQRSFSGVHG